jgi:hypothetical protein
VRAIVIAVLAACGAAPREPAVAPPAISAVAPDAPHQPDPDLDRQPVPKLLAIDWDKVQLGSDADAMALWNQIAPTGGDWQSKLYEVPTGPISKALALAILRAGNFTCVHSVPSQSCSTRMVQEVEEPDPSATLADPCLRRSLAMWAFDQLDGAELAPARAAMQAIVAIPPPESDLVSSAFDKDRDNPDQDERLDLIARGWNAGNRDIVAAALGGLDEQHLVEAVRKDHIDPALEILSIQGQRALYLASMTDAKLDAKTRVQIVADLVEEQPNDPGSDGRSALLAATKSPSCEVAAAAAHALVRYHMLGQPKPPATMHTLCVVASYEHMQLENETSPLAELIPPRGFELIRVGTDFDAGSDNRSIDVIPRYAAVFPETDDIVHAFEHCKGTTCISDEHEFHFTMNGGMLTRLEIDERPDCAPPP